MTTSLATVFWIVMIITPGVPTAEVSPVGIFKDQKVCEETIFKRWTLNRNRDRLPQYKGKWFACVPYIGSRRKVAD